MPKFDKPEFVYGGNKCWDCLVEFNFLTTPVKVFYYGWHPGYANTPNAYTMCVDCYEKWSKIHPQDDYKEFNPNPGRTTFKPSWPIFRPNPGQT